MYISRNGYEAVRTVPSVLSITNTRRMLSKSSTTSNLTGGELVSAGPMGLLQEL